MLSNADEPSCTTAADFIGFLQQKYFEGKFPEEAFISVMIIATTGEVRLNLFCSEGVQERHVLNKLQVYMSLLYHVTF